MDRPGAGFQKSINGGGDQDFLVRLGLAVLGVVGMRVDTDRMELARSVIAETRTTHRGATRTVYQVDVPIARLLSDQCIYVEQGKSSAGEAPAAVRIAHLGTPRSQTDNGSAKPGL